MKTTVLSNHEINDLIRRYESELRKLQFQLEKTNATIRDLYEMRDSADVSPAPAAERAAITFVGGVPEQEEEKQEKSAPVKRRRRGRPPKSASKDQGGSETSKAEKPTRKRKGKRVRRKTGGYRLSGWDQVIVNGLEEKGKIMVNADFFERAMQYNNEAGHGLDESDVRGKVSRSLHKLANKRGDIIKVNFEGKGYAYALPGWLKPSGELKKKHA